jgi:hypothetical protein
MGNVSDRRDDRCKATCIHSDYGGNQRRPKRLKEMGGPEGVFCWWTLRHESDSGFREERGT